MQHPAAASQPQRRHRSSGVRCAAATVEFAKYHGLGNDFILVSEPPPPPPPPPRGAHDLYAFVCRPDCPLASARAVDASALWQVDNRHEEEPMLTAEQAVRLCDRNFGIGGDGVCAELQNMLLASLWLCAMVADVAARCLLGPPQPLLARCSLTPWRHARTRAVAYQFRPPPGLRVQCPSASQSSRSRQAHCCASMSGCAYLSSTGDPAA